MSPYTLYDVVNMVVAAGGVPCFADIEEHTCNISGREVERLIGRQTGAVLVTHLHGLVACLIGSESVDLLGSLTLPSTNVPCTLTPPQSPATSPLTVTLVAD